MNSAPRICLVQPSLNEVSETFLRAHAERLPGVVGIAHRLNEQVAVNGVPVLGATLGARATRKFHRVVRRRSTQAEIHAAYEQAFRRLQANVVIAEYGTVAGAVLPACERLSIPVIVYFRGYDATCRQVLKSQAENYQRIFRQAFAVMAVSRSIARQLVSIGCPAGKIVISPSGVDVEEFHGADPAGADPVFVSVGRLVEKKAPHLTVAAFARVVEEHPEARLRIIGDGPLRGVVEDLVAALHLEESVAVLGAQPHDVVRGEMLQARGLVLHSVVAQNGDSEGTPNVVLEAGALGLPVVATRHAGIPDVIVEGETGLLVDERDADGMAEHLKTLIRDPERARELGRNAAAFVRRHFTMDQSLGRLRRVVAAAVGNGDLHRIRAEIASELPMADSDSETAAVAATATTAIPSSVH